MKVALTHDYLREYGGAERVLEVLHEIYPEAPLYTAYYNPQKLGKHAQKFGGWDIRTSWYQKMPFANQLLSPMRILAPLMFESFDLSEYDLVISSSSAVYFSKAVLTKPETLHISYIHTPPRYLYGYTTAFDYKKHWWTRLGAMVINHFLRLWDFEISQRPDILVANSENIRKRIQKFYRRDSVVIYPPVDLSEFRDKRQETRDKGSDDYFLYLGRLDPGKRVDLIIKACLEAEVPLKVAGAGKGDELNELRKAVGSKQKAEGNIEFLGAVTDSERVKLYANAKALIVAAEDEDFGITPIEAQAAGTPVIALRAGGYLETVVEGKTGEFFEQGYRVQGAGCSLVEILQKFDPGKYKAEDCRKNAARFDKKEFIEKFKKLVESNCKKQ